MPIKSSFSAITLVASQQRPPQPVSSARVFFLPAEVKQKMPQCSICKSKDRYIEKGKLLPFCSKRCLMGFDTNNLMCLQCEVAPRAVAKTGKNQLFCSVACMHKNQIVVNDPVKPPTASYPELEKMISADAQTSLSPTLPVQIPQTFPFKEMTVAQMKAWVFEQHALLQPFAPLFESCQIDGCLFLEMTDEDFQEIGIDNDQARQLILSCRQHAVNGPTLRLCAEGPPEARPLGRP